MYINKRFDIIFMDPPYFSSHIKDCLEIIFSRNLLNENGIIVAESDKLEVFPETIAGFSLKDERVYGRVKVSFYGM